MSLLRAFSVIIMDPVGERRELHGDVRASGNTRFRGSESNQRWVFHSVQQDGTFGRLTGPLKPVACISQTIWRRCGVDLVSTGTDPVVHDELYAVCENGRRYYVGKVEQVLDPRQVALGDIGSGEGHFGNEPFDAMILA